MKAQFIFEKLKFERNFEDPYRSLNIGYSSNVEEFIPIYKDIIDKIETDDFYKYRKNFSTEIIKILKKNTGYYA